MLCLSMHVYADVFACKNDKGGIVYQDKPCIGGTVRKVDILPPPSAEEREAAEQRLQRINEQSNKFALAAESERQQQEKYALEQERIALERRRVELLEQRALAEQNANQWVRVNPYYINQWKRNPWHNRKHDVRHDRDKRFHAKENNDSGLTITVK